MAGAIRLIDGELAESGAVLDLLDRAAADDGFSAVNEAGRLALHAGGTGRRHLLSGPPQAPTGYAALESAAADPHTGWPVLSAELVVDPAARHRGVGVALLNAVLSAAGPRSTVAFWAHHDTAAARALATGAGLIETRVLLLLARDLDADPPLPTAPLPSGIRLAAFRPGVDDDAWLAVNAAAFAEHPEQGRWTTPDLAARIAEPWFDPAGFLLAWSRAAGAAQDGRLLGFHWTKVDEAPDGSLVGEIYVLGVAPDAGVRGLGTALGVAGLEHLRSRGVGPVELYVEAANTRALGIYRRLGFVEHSRDVQWRRDGRDEH